MRSFEDQTRTWLNERINTDEGRRFAREDTGSEFVGEGGSGWVVRECGEGDRICMG